MAGDACLAGPARPNPRSRKAVLDCGQAKQQACKPNRGLPERTPSPMHGKLIQAPDPAAAALTTLTTSGLPRTLYACRVWPSVNFAREDCRRSHAAVVEDHTSEPARACRRSEFDHPARGHAWIRTPAVACVSGACAIRQHQQAPTPVELRIEVGQIVRSSRQRPLVYDVKELVWKGW